MTIVTRFCYLNTYKVDFIKHSSHLLQYEISLINELLSVWYCTLYQTNVFIVLFKIGPSRVNKKNQRASNSDTFSSRPVLGNTNKGTGVSKIYVQWLSHAGLWDWRGCSQWHVTDWSPNHMTAGYVWPSPARKIFSMITMHRSQYSRIYRWRKECFVTVHHLINLGRWTNLHQRHFIVVSWKHSCTLSIQYLETAVMGIIWMPTRQPCLIGNTLGSQPQSKVYTKKLSSAICPTAPNFCRIGGNWLKLWSRTW